MNYGWATHKILKLHFDKIMIQFDGSFSYRFHFHGLKFNEGLRSFQDHRILILETFPFFREGYL